MRKKFLSNIGIIWNGSYKHGIILGRKMLPPSRVVYNGDGNVFLMGAPEEIEKVLIPNILTMEYPMFIYDEDGKLWDKTAGGRQIKRMEDMFPFLDRNSVKIQPMCQDGSAASWNPLLDIRLGTIHELEDTEALLRILLNFPKDAEGDTFWQDSSLDFMEGLVLHLLYKANKESTTPPTIKKLLDILAMPDLDSLFEEMKVYAHISTNDFFGGLENFSKEAPWKFDCPLESAYGEYVNDFAPISKELGVPIHSLHETRLALIAKAEWKGYENLLFHGEIFQEYEEPLFKSPDANPLCRLLTHPKAYQAAVNMMSMQEITRSSVLQTIRAALHIYKDPILQKNTEASDFGIRKFRRDAQDLPAVYFIADGSQGGHALAKLFVSTLMRRIATGGDPSGWCQPLILLPNFPAMGKLPDIQHALQSRPKESYRVIFGCQSIEEVHRVYSDENIILRSCDLIGCFAPERGKAKSAAFVNEMLSNGENFSQTVLEQKLHHRMLLSEKNKKLRFIRQSTFKTDPAIHERLGYPPPSKSKLMESEASAESILYGIFFDARFDNNNKSKEKFQKDVEASGQTEKEYCQTLAEKEEQEKLAFKELLIEAEKQETAWKKQQASSDEPSSEATDDPDEDPPLPPEVRDRIRQKIGELIKINPREVADPVKLKAMKMEFIKRFLKEKKL